MSMLGFRGTIRFKKRLEVENIEGFRWGGIVTTQSISTVPSEFDTLEVWEVSPNNAVSELAKGILTEYYLRAKSSIVDNVASIACVIPRETMQDLFRWDFIEIIENDT